MYACTTIGMALLSRREVRFRGGRGQAGPPATTAYARRCASRYRVARRLSARSFRRRGCPVTRAPGPSDRSITLGEIGEFGLIAEITRNLPAAEDVLIGPGDDAAVLDLHGPVVTTVDVLVEGVHFRRDWSDAVSVGRKAVAVNLADLEAMGARPRAVVVGFSAPEDLP